MFKIGFKFKSFLDSTWRLDLKKCVRNPALALYAVASRKMALFSIVCLALLQTISTAALANSPPSFDQLNNVRVAVGEFVDFSVRAVDTDGHVPGLFVDSAPSGSEFVDNGDGSRSFRWRPNQSHIGQHRMLFVTVDALDASLRFSQSVFIDVVPAAQSTVDTANSANNNSAATAAVVSNESNQSNLRVVTGDLITIEGNSFPRINMVSTTVNTLAGQALDVVVSATDTDGPIPGLVVHTLPAGASFNDNGDGTRSINWTPLPWQLGQFRVVIVAIDAQRNDHRVQTELTIDVTEAPANNTQANNPPVQTAPVAAPVTEPPTVPAANNNSSNRPPFFDGLTNQVVALGQTIQFVVAPRDPDGDVPGMFADRLPNRSSFQDNFDGTRTLTWRPFPIDEGDYWITFTAVDARDDSLRTQQSIKITVENRGGFNFEPVINGINNPVIRAGDLLRQKVQPVDPDGEVAHLSVLNPPEGATFPDNGDGTRTLFWQTDFSDITEFGDSDNPHTVDFLAVDARDASLRDDHRLSISVVEPSTRNRTGERLRVLAERRGLLVGYAAMLESFSLADADIYLDIAAEEFNIVSPENSHKWDWIQPQRGQFRFEDADALADFAVDKGMVLHGHPLIWYTQLPGWVLAMDLQDGEAIMYEHIDALVSRYRDKVALWDVVNEALEEDGTFRNSVWFQAMGRDYIRKAFIRSRERDADSILLYNDYDVAWTGPKSDGMYRLLQSELNRGTPIDGVGFQMHLWTDFDDFGDVRDNLQRFANLGLDIYITELDVAMSARGQEEKQAQVYENVMRICLEQPACKAVQSWGFTDRYSWRYNNRPLLFTERYHAKPAYYALQRALSR